MDGEKKESMEKRKRCCSLLGIREVEEKGAT